MHLYHNKINIFYHQQILFDFGLMFGHIQEDQLIQKWATVRGIPFAKYDIRIDGNKHPISMKSDEAHDLLCFFKLIPTHKISFDVSVNALLTYSGVSKFIQ